MGPQFFETTVTDSNQALTARFVSFPKRAFNLCDVQIPTSLDSLKASLEFSQVITLSDIASIPVLFSLLLQEMSLPFDLDGNKISVLRSSIKPDVYKFAEELTFADVVPVESSPLSLESIASLIMKAATVSPAALGAVTAYLSFGPVPILIVAVPTGVVLCGAAISFGKWFDENRNKIFNRIFKFRDRPQKKDG